MNDSISRQAAIETVKKHYRVDNDLLEVIAYEIEALPSAQPGCEDAVSRADVDILIEEAQTAWLRGDILLMYPALKKGLKKVPPVTPKQPGWIPCSERCPDKSEWYLVTEEWDDGFTFVTKDRYVVGEGWTYAVFGTKCLAWMPLPKPWKGEKDDG